MALIKCTKCGHMISDKANACPKCGAIVESNNETRNELHSNDHVYSQQDRTKPLQQKKKTSSALIATIALLSLAVLALGGYALYKMVYEPSLLDQSSQEEVLIDMSDKDVVGTTDEVNEHAESVVRFHSTNDVLQYIEGKTYTCGDYSLLLSDHGYCIIDGHELDATLKVNKFHETTAQITAFYRTIASDFNATYEIDASKGTLERSVKGKKLTFCLKGNDRSSHAEKTQIKEPVDAAADENISSDNAWLAQRYATNEDIAGLSSDEIRIMRNSIFARHGRYFNDPVLQEYFNSQSWYHPYRKEVPTQELNEYERKNIEFLKKHE